MVKLDLCYSYSYFSIYIKKKKNFYYLLIPVTNMDLNNFLLTANSLLFMLEAEQRQKLGKSINENNCYNYLVTLKLMDFFFL